MMNGDSGTSHKTDKFTYRIPWRGYLWIEQQFHQRYISVYLAASRYCTLQIGYHPKHRYIFSLIVYPTYQIGSYVLGILEDSSSAT